MIVIGDIYYLEDCRIPPEWEKFKHLVDPNWRQSVPEKYNGRPDLQKLFYLAKLRRTRQLLRRYREWKARDEREARKAKLELFKSGIQDDGKDIQH